MKINLGPETMEARVNKALEQVRPYLGSHGGDVEIVAIDENEGLVAHRMKGSCDGCPSSMLTVKMAVETTIRQAAPEAVRIEVEGLTEPASSVAEKDRESVAWTTIDASGVNGTQVGAEVNGARIVLCRVDGRLYAYRDVCPPCNSAIEAGNLAGELLECPQCASRSNVKLAERSIRSREIHLEPLPLLEDRDGIKIAMPSTAAA